MLKMLFTSRVRVKLLKILVARPAERFFIRQLVRLTGEQINAVRRELARLTKIGLLRRKGINNRLYYQIQTDHPLYGGLLGLIAAEVGLGRRLLEHRDELGDIRYAFLTTAFARGRAAGTKDVDLLVIGKISLQRLQRLVAETEKELGHEVNYTVMSREEFEFRKKRKDSFLAQLFRQGRIMLVGNENAMVF